MHGFQHVYENRQSGIMKLTKHSEFTGLSLESQRRKIGSGVSIFSRHQVKPAAWIAPAHSFDWTTVRLLPEFGIKVISDGLWRWPHTDKFGITWVPQQIWNFKPRPPGIWTICLHHNRWTTNQLDQFIRELAQYADKIDCFSEVVAHFQGRHLNLADQCVAKYDFTLNHRLIPLAGLCVNALVKRR